MTLFDRTDRHGNRIPLIEQQGMVFLSDLMQLIPGLDLEEQFKRVKDMEIRDDDVLICAFHKSGTHWLYEIVCMLVNGSAEYVVTTKEAEMLEIAPKGAIDGLPSPRVLNTHLPLDLLSRQLLRKRRKVIHILRNPKDLVVSWYHHYKIFGEKLGFGLFQSLEDFIPYFTGEYGFYLICPWVQYIKDFHDKAKEEPTMVLNIYFEDLKQNSKGQVAKIAEFLGVRCSEELIAAIAEKCEFKKLKKANDTVKQDKGEIMRKDGTSLLYRKGVVGDWRNEFTVAQNEQFDAWLEKHLKDTDFRWTFEL